MFATLISPCPGFLLKFHFSITGREFKLGIDEMTKMTIFHAKRLIWRGFSSLSSNPLCVCIVGCGTAGFYIVEIDLSRIYSAREFVWWYNGHPDHSNLAPDLKSTDTPIILGQGNVALDVARMLFRPSSELETTDIADCALASLAESV